MSWESVGAVLMVLIPSATTAVIVWVLAQRSQDKERRYQDRRAQIDRDATHWANLRSFHIETVIEVQSRLGAVFELTYQAYRDGMRNPRADQPETDEPFEPDSPQYRLFQEVAKFRLHVSRLSDSELRTAIQALERDLVRVAFFGRYRTPLEKAQTRAAVSELGLRRDALNQVLGALINGPYNQPVPVMNPDSVTSPAVRYQPVGEHRGPLAGVTVPEGLLIRRRQRTLPQSPIHRRRRVLRPVRRADADPSEHRDRCSRQPAERSVTSGFGRTIR